MTSAAPIIVKKKKAGGGGHHGGAWKIAYADFVTAMMAFFLLMWLLSSTTEEQKLGIANYFNPTISLSRGGGSTGVLDGASPLSLQGSQDVAGPEQSAVESEEEEEEEDEEENELDEADAAMAAAEEQRFDEVESEIREQLAGLPELQHVADNLIMDRTDEGLRIQLVDRDQATSMFSSGSAQPLEHTRQLLDVVAQAVSNIPEDISIEGHTDALPFTATQTYDNWDLSVERANMARRLLQDAGIAEQRFATVVGYAAREPLMAEDPADPRNRRISIVLKRLSAASSTPAAE